jgi:hypothetical protein
VIQFEALFTGTAQYRSLALLRCALLACALTASHVSSAQSARPLTRQEPAPRARLAYVEGQSIPEGYRLKSGPRKGLVIGGAILGGSAYVLGVLGALDGNFANHSGYLFIPVAGPWLMLAAGRDRAKPCATPGGCGSDPDYTPMLLSVGDVLAGTMQAVGSALLITGLTTRSFYLQRDSVAVSFSPVTFGPRRYGLGANGSF